jgi:hypothetical protein
MSVVSSSPWLWNEPAFCGLGTLTTVLNALAIDPQRAWKGVWRQGLTLVYTMSSTQSSCVPSQRNVTPGDLSVYPSEVLKLSWES